MAQQLIAFTRAPLPVPPTNAAEQTPAATSNAQLGPARTELNRRCTLLHERFKKHARQM
jgi:hypothetical protein